MGSFSGLGIGLSLVFGFILMGLVAEIYYLLWWKKRTTISSGEIGSFCCMFCWKKLNSVNSSQEQINSVKNLAESSNGHEEIDPELGSNKDLQLKGYGEDGVETELMRLHNLCGPPRFLFTINEENKEDLESDDGKSKGERSSRKGSRTRSLSDLFIGVDGTGTPISSPSIKAFDSCYNHGFNPLFESLSEAEINRLRSSPPPKFKFLKDAEDKLLRRLLTEEAEKKRASMNMNGVSETENSRNLSEDEKTGSFMLFINKNHNKESQVLPLASSPTFKHQLDKKSSVK
ncbi:uncharacterized protein LOC111387648 [Olea europaea var. sylvestris]|uniref:Uncharacterized protein n=1 Tax=Olea europaea subsp. europaea TaxID=158383 RepID=A0A8S0UZA5_OLEEU|nr:uncharacterized protein LOC111387648 [Olea europaea var. sylvestris]CAA3026186.1 Hypothetical predicted protein [Olea europaea subsp. europaea]